MKHDDYTVGWISALSTEMAAAVGMLDDEHESLPLPQQSNNQYTLGRIGQHNVVLACLPDGVYGTTSAAVVATEMLSTFPSMRIGLMVGIGGGVPQLPDYDIRLGDVVVARPTTTNGGVIQYDLGKSTEGGQFHRVGFLNGPPQVLLVAVTKLRAKHLTGHHELLKHISKMIEMHPLMRDRYAYEGTQMDELFDASYDHVAGESTCRHCDTQKLVYRGGSARKTPSIHYGLVASGNQVIKDATTRDSVRARLRDGGDGEVLCFEMEAAGLLNTFPCLVIRGICDYADTHKNKDWQHRAAATAAAYAKELLGEISGTQVAIIARAAEATAETIAKPACYFIPFTRNHRFVGRGDLLDEIESKLFGTGYSQKVAITGLGGMGKTQIVLELAFRTKEKRPFCSIFWITATSFESFERSYSEIGQILQIPGVADEKADVKSLVQNYLSQEQAGDWLMILDNADDLDIFFKDVSKPGSLALINFVPISSKGSIVCTTRDRRVAVKMAQSNVTDVLQMDENVAIEVLKKSLINPEIMNDHQNVLSLLKRLTLLPLAIVQAAAYINENNSTISEYLSLFDDTEEDIIAVLSEEFEDPGRYRESKNPVATTWLISFEQVRRRDALAIEFLSFMSCLDPDMIPQSVLPSVQPKKRATDALGTLKAYSFISRRPANQSSAHQSFDLHPLVHLVTRNWLREKGDLSAWTIKVVARLADIFPSSDHSNKATWTAYLPHVYRVLDSDVLPEDVGETFILLEKVGDCILADGKYGDAEKIFRRVLQRRENTMGDDHVDTLMIANTLAYTLTRLGRDLEAGLLSRRTLEGLKRKLGQDHFSTQRSMLTTASIYWSQGQLTEAEELDIQVMETTKRVLGHDHPDTLTSMGNLASTYRDQGRWTEAEELEIQVMETTKRVLGHDHPDTLTSMGNLASTYRNQGRWTEAEELEIQVMETRKRVLGHDHPDTLTSMGSLALTYWNQGRWTEAEELEIHVMETRKRVLGHDHPSTLTSMGNLASTYRNQGRWTEAEELDIQVMETRKRVLGHEHPSTLTSMGNLASTYRDQGRWTEAEELDIQVTETRKRVLGHDHPDTLTSMGNLASTYRNQGRWTEAEELEIQVVVTTKRVLGHEHPDTLTSMGSLASTYWNQGRWTEAEELEIQVMETMKRVLGHDHPDTLTSMGNLASTYRNQGRWTEAEELDIQVMETTKRVLGHEHPSTLTSMANLAVTWKSQGSEDSALKLLAETVELRKATLGLGHPSTVNCLEMLEEWRKEKDRVDSQR